MGTFDRELETEWVELMAEIGRLKGFCRSALYGRATEGLEQLREAAEACDQVIGGFLSAHGEDLTRVGLGLQDEVYDLIRLRATYYHSAIPQTPAFEEIYY